MYETQPTREQQTSQREAFLGFAREVGLDMAKFETALDDPATPARVLDDRDDGVSGTPTFFVNGVQFQDSQPTKHSNRSSSESW